jgi:hypothetical protein
LKEVITKNKPVVLSFWRNREDRPPSLLNYQGATTAAIRRAESRLILIAVFKAIWGEGSHIASESNPFQGLPGAVVRGFPKVSEICLGTMTFGEEWGWGSSKRQFSISR